ncbi:hypothetical protein [Burkholderia ambifaria]|uniref:hypothetical protein n=1 Tax=Burkholderia ambifaria TaxID=152480 RepID=UPI002FE07A11
MPYYVQLTRDVVIALSALSSTESTAKLDAACPDFVVLGGAHTPPAQPNELDEQGPAVRFGSQRSLL